MKHALLAAVALAGLMEEANDGTTGSAGGAVGGSGEAHGLGAGREFIANANAAADEADAAGTKPSEPAAEGAAQAEPEGDAEVQPEPEKAVDELANAWAAGSAKVALVEKYSERIPVQLKSQAHLDALVAEHGVAAVRVTS